MGWKSIELPYDTEISLLGIYPDEMKTYLHKKTCTKMLLAAVGNSQKVGTIQMSLNLLIDK
jgi:hypothetical protein